jgi:hypothetical protein
VSTLALEQEVFRREACIDSDGGSITVQTAIEAGYDEVYMQQIGSEQEGFLRFYEKGILPRVPRGGRRQC